MADAATYATIQNEIAYYAAPAKDVTRYIQMLIFNSLVMDQIHGHPNTDWLKLCSNLVTQNYENVNVSVALKNEILLSLGSKFQDAYYKHSATNFTQYDSAVTLTEDNREYKSFFRRCWSSGR